MRAENKIASDVRAGRRRKHRLTRLRPLFRLLPILLPGTQSLVSSFFRENNAHGGDKPAGPSIRCGSVVAQYYGST